MHKCKCIYNLLNGRVYLCISFYPNKAIQIAFKTHIYHFMHSLGIEPMILILATGFYGRLSKWKWIVHLKNSFQTNMTFFPNTIHVFFPYQRWAADSWGKHHVAVLAVGVLVVIVFSLSLAQMRTHLLMAGHGAGLHECHAGQHRFTAKQPSLCRNTTTNIHICSKTN